MEKKKLLIFPTPSFLSPFPPCPFQGLISRLSEGNCVELVFYRILEKQKLDSSLPPPPPSSTPPTPSSAVSDSAEATAEEGAPLSQSLPPPPAPLSAPLPSPLVLEGKEKEGGEGKREGGGVGGPVAGGEAASMPERRGRLPRDKRQVYFFRLF